MELDALKDTPVAVNMYEGNDLVIAKSTYDFLKTKKDSGDILEMPTLRSKVRIVDVLSMQTEDPMSLTTRYKIMTKVLIII
jgi:hypothetical protein